MDLDVRHLRVVAGIAEAGSMTRAAAGLHLTQSALSHTLRDIESRFGTPFFLRLGKRMVLTPAGQIVLEAATTVIAELRRTEEEVRRIAGQIDPVIRVCTQCNTGYHWLAPLLAIFNRKHPRVTINIVADATDRPVEAMLAGRLDLAILTSDNKDRRLRQRTLFTDEMVTRRGLRRQWRAATLRAQPDSPALTDFITLLAERAIPVRHAAALRRATA